MKNSTLKHLISPALKLCYLLPLVMAFGTLTMCTSGTSTLKYGLKMYVSTAGNDNWTGKRDQPDENKSDGPFASLEGARTAIRNLKESKKLPKGNIIIEIQEGIYEIPRTFDLDSTDGGGDARSRIIYLGQQGKEVRLTGGKYVSKWDLVSEKDVLGMLSPDVRDKVYQSDLSAIGISDFGSPGGGGIELFFNDKPMWISRYPNKGFIKITGLLNEQPVDVRGTKGDKVGDPAHLPGSHRRERRALQRQMTRLGRGGDGGACWNGDAVRRRVAILQQGLQHRAEVRRLFLNRAGKTPHRAKRHITVGFLT